MISCEGRCSIEFEADVRDAFGDCPMSTYRGESILHDLYEKRMSEERRALRLGYCRRFLPNHWRDVTRERSVAGPHGATKTAKRSAKPSRRNETGYCVIWATAPQSTKHFSARLRW